MEAAIALLEDHRAQNEDDLLTVEACDRVIGWLKEQLNN